MKSFTLALLAAALVVVPSSAQAQEAIDGQYIVVLKENASTASADRAKTKARDRGGRIQRESFGRVLNGFSAKLDGKALAAVKQDAAVDFVEQDQCDPAQRDPDQRDLGPGPHRPARPAAQHARTPTANTGAGVTAYIIDTGIRLTHTELRQAARRAATTRSTAAPADDCNGHGTHVAGTVGGTTLRRGQGRPAGRRAGARLQRLAAPPRA